MNSGKSHLLNALCRRLSGTDIRPFHEGENASTKYLKVVRQLSSTGDVELVLIDTAGVFVDADPNESLDLIRAIRNGLKDGTNLSNRAEWSNPANIEKRNEVHQFILVGAAYVVIKTGYQVGTEVVGPGWFSFFFGKGNTSNSHATETHPYWDKLRALAALAEKASGTFHALWVVVW